jgi:hypothetical protein
MQCQCFDLEAETEDASNKYEFRKEEHCTDRCIP